MSRLGPWKPTNTEERLDRMESLAEIRQLPYRYALSLDSRDMKSLVALFTPDVRVGPKETGRPALERWFTQVMSKMRTSIHLVGNHIIDFEAADRARGIVYCRDELERPDVGEWEVGLLQYWDSYVRVEGEWCFERRKFHRWYIVDALTRPSHGGGSYDSALTTSQLPEAFPTWGEFWQQVDKAST